MSGVRKRRAAVAAACFALLGVVAASAWQWPTGESEITVGFGQPLDHGSMSTGVVVGSPGQEVFAAHQGELVFRAAERPETPGQLTHPLGTYAIAEHGRNFRAIYGHLDSTAVGDGGVQLDSQTTVGTTGASGFAMDPGLFLQIRDQEREAYVNPHVMLPQRPDEQGPMAEGIWVSSGPQAELVPLAQADALSSGPVLFYVSAYDINNAGEIPRRVAPYRIDLFIDEEPADTVQFETVHAAEQSLELAGRVPAAQLSRGSWRLYAGTVELDPGTYPVSVVVADYAGNSVEIGGALTVAAAE